MASCTCSVREQDEKTEHEQVVFESEGGAIGHPRGLGLLDLECQVCLSTGCQANAEAGTQSDTQKQNYERLRRLVF